MNVGCSYIAISNILYRMYNSLAKEGPWVVHFILGSNRGGGLTFEASILCSTKQACKTVHIVYDIEGLGTLY